MKKIIALAMAACLVLGASAQAAFAAGEARWDSGPVYDSGSVVITPEDSRNIELKGDIEPTIISVVMPSFIPFSISRSMATENKVLSPRIDVANHSSLPVSVYVDNTRVDLSQLSGTTWGTSAYVGYNELAIGMVNSQSQPTGLSGARWLLNGNQHTSVLNSVAPGQTLPLYLVGTLGAGVPENRSFTVMATLVVKRA